MQIHVPVHDQFQIFLWGKKSTRNAQTLLMVYSGRNMQI